MEPGGLTPHSQKLSNNAYPEPKLPIPRVDTYFFEIHSNIVLPSSLGLPKGLFPVGLSITILKPLLPSSNLAI